MSFEAITTVREAEARAKQIKTEAAQSAAEAIEAAELDGKAAVDAALAKAREELRTLRSKSDEKATQDAEALAATIIPAVAIPVSLIGTFLFMHVIGMSINKIGRAHV